MYNGCWAIWPERMFITYDKMRMRLHDEVENKEFIDDLTHDEVNVMEEDCLVELCGNWWTFTSGTPSWVNY